MTYRLQLEGGRLPIPITLIQERGVDAILGADSLAKSVVAGMVGLALVFLFMTLYYRVPGLVASVALLLYATMVLAIFKLLPVTLTLSGVAATILSVGMAVDANVLIFERMKDELRNGRTLISAINIGFNRAWPAIRDSNVSTLITCGILFYFSQPIGDNHSAGLCGYAGYRRDGQHVLRNRDKQDNTARNRIHAAFAASRRVCPHGRRRYAPASRLASHSEELISWTS